MTHTEEHKEGYKTAFKATALFGGVQIFTILTSLVKNKLVAVWLGSAGMGIMNLFSSTLDLISYVTNLGLQSSAVRDIANASGKADQTLVSKIVKAINRWVLATGLMGAAVTIALSPLLSRWVFDSDAYTLSFILLSCVVLMTGIYNGNYALLQGMRRLKYMANANIFGALAGFVCSVPMFYFFRERGIVPALILTSLATLVVSFFYVRKVRLAQVDQTWKESYRLGLSTLKLGIMMSLSGIGALLVQFLVKVFITRMGGGDGVEHVGLYAAGWSINVQYLGLVFTAMAKDYYPRLSQVASDNGKVKKMMNQQAEIAILIIAPLIIGMIIFLPFIIRLLYTEEFLGVVEMTRWMLLGSLFKAGSWAISFVFLAKGDGKTHLFNELGICVLILPIYLLGYYFFGLEGLGYAFVLTYLIYMVWVLIISFVKYKIRYTGEYWRIFFVLLATQTVYIIVTQLLTDEVVKNIISSATMVLVGIYCVYEFNKRIRIKDLINLRK